MVFGPLLRHCLQIYMFDKLIYLEISFTQTGQLLGISPDCQLTFPDGDLIPAQLLDRELVPSSPLVFTVLHPPDHGP